MKTKIVSGLIAGLLIGVIGLFAEPLSEKNVTYTVKLTQSTAKDVPGTNGNNKGKTTLGSAIHGWGNSIIWHELAGTRVHSPTKECKLYYKPGTENKAELELIFDHPVGTVTGWYSLVYEIEISESGLRILNTENPKFVPGRTTNYSNTYMIPQKTGKVTLAKVANGVYTIDCRYDKGE